MCACFFWTGLNEYSIWQIWPASRSHRPNGIENNTVSLYSCVANKYVRSSCQSTNECVFALKMVAGYRERCFIILYYYYFIWIAISRHWINPNESSRLFALEFTQMGFLLYVYSSWNLIANGTIQSFMYRYSHQLVIVAHILWSKFVFVFLFVCTLCGIQSLQKEPQPFLIRNKEGI